jgi:hypothetical protein
LLVEFWSHKLLGEQLPTTISEEIKSTVVADMREMADQDWSILRKEHADGLEYKLMQIVSLIALSPKFHKR